MEYLDNIVTRLVEKCISDSPSYGELTADNDIITVDNDIITVDQEITI
jgi:hypothetical protein